MKDMVPKGTGNSRFLRSSIAADITHEELVALLRSGKFPVDFAGLNSAGIHVQGSAYNKANVLPDTVCTRLNIPTSSEPKDAFLSLSNKGGWKEIARITTSKTWTVPTGVTQIGVLAIGGGQSGSVEGNLPDGYSRFVFGGFCGHVATGAFDVSAGQKFSVTIGAGGTSPVFDNGDIMNSDIRPKSGGKTSFSGNGILLSANGGGVAEGASLGGNGFYGNGRLGRYNATSSNQYSNLVGDTLPFGKTSNVVSMLFSQAGTGEDYYLLYTFSDDFYLFDPGLKLLSPGGFVSAKYSSGEFINISQINPPDLGALGRGGQSKCEVNVAKLVGEDATGYGNGGGSVLTAQNFAPSFKPTTTIRAGNGSPGIVIIYA